MNTQSALNGQCHELCFKSLYCEGRALSFPCDAKGQVRIDSLSDRARANYFYARTVVGREFHCPAVLRRVVDAANDEVA